MVLQLDGATAGQEYDDGMIQLVADYDNGAGMKAQFAYANYTDVSPTSTISIAPNDGQPAGGADATGMRVTVRYDMGGIELNGTYQMLELDNAVALTGMTNTGYNGKTIERDTMALAVSIPTSTGRVIVSYGSSDDASVDGTSLSESGVTTYKVAYYYDLSANVYLFGHFGKQNEDANYDTADTTEESNTTKVIGKRFLF